MQGRGMVSFVVAVLVLELRVCQAVVTVQDDKYPSCHTGKGTSKLYNCGYKYNHEGDNRVHLPAHATPTRYMIKLKKGVPASKVDEICLIAETNKTAYPGYCISKYEKVWLGMLMVMTGQNLQQLLLQEMAVIEHVEVEGQLRVSTIISQIRPASWGLDRIDHQPGQNLLNQIYTVNTSGDGVHVYVLDTGIRCTHQEFWYQDGRLDQNLKPISRCLTGFDGIGDGVGTLDCNGHGTHCAGIVAGVQSGVAKNAFVHPVRVMSCDGAGSFGAIIAGLEWISINYIAPAVLSMSIAATASISIDQAVNQLVNSTGIVVVAAAGNFKQITCNYSPARATSAIAVGSSNILNLMSWFSNYGVCTTIFAPGELIVSSWNTSDIAFNTLSGTSMACPHVAGAAALLLGQNGDARPSDVREALLDVAEPAAIVGLFSNTTTKLINVNIKQPPFQIHPRSFYETFEGTTQISTVMIKSKPLQLVVLTPTVDPTIGYFQPAQLYFTTDASWSVAQSIKLILLLRPDFLDKSSLIQWVFTSQDERYDASPEGYVMSLDTGVCKMTEKNPCGQTADNPKIIPGVPFYYYDNSNNYKNVYDSPFDYCHSTGPDVVFQHTPMSDLNATVSLCGPNTNFDTTLSVYEKVLLNGKSQLNRIACNDDYCSVQSLLSKLLLKRNHTYVFMVDGWGAGGPFDFNLTVPAATATTNSATTRALSVQSPAITNSDQDGCTQWIGKTCVEKPPTAPWQDTYFWSAASWSPCNHVCAGGIQHAVIKCYMGNFLEAPELNCAHLPLPQATRSCNMVACRSYSVYEGYWSECNQTCGSGIQRREVTCMDNLGNTASPESCEDQQYFVTERECNTHVCNATYWEVPKWNYCNVPCSGGKRFRDIICQSNGTVVGDDVCSSVNAPDNEQLCNSQPCQTYAWLVGPWNDECPVGCNSTTTRHVECVDGWGEGVEDQHCDIGSKPGSTMQCQRTDVACDDCRHNNCSGNGGCMAGRCKCIGHWEGRYCETLKICEGRPVGYLRNGSVGCCPYEAIDNEQHCCITANATLTSDGYCCEGGYLDACGACNGTAISLDFHSKCCSTIRDEKGICCNSGFLDECLICDGDSTSCAANIRISLIFNSTIEIPHNSSAQWKEFILYFSGDVGDKLGVSPEALLLTAVQLSDTYIGNCGDALDREEGCLVDGIPAVTGIFNFTVLPIPGGNIEVPNMIHGQLQDMSIKKHEIAEQLSSLGDQEEGFVVNTSVHAERAGICGNGMCEQGERCDQMGKSATKMESSSCCLKDCPFVSHTCPIPPNGPRASRSCAGNGLCLDASGQCSCFLGYRGIDCQQCTFGWKSSTNGSCIKLANDVEYAKMGLSALPDMSWKDDRDSEGFSRIAGLALAAVTGCGVLLCVVTFLYMHYWNPQEVIRSCLYREPSQREHSQDEVEHQDERLSSAGKSHSQEPAEATAAKHGQRSLLEASTSTQKQSSHRQETDAPRTAVLPDCATGWRKSLLLGQEGGITGWRKSLVGKQQVEYGLLEDATHDGVQSVQKPKPAHDDVWSSSPTTPPSNWLTSFAEDTEGIPLKPLHTSPPQDTRLILQTADTRSQPQTTSSHLQEVWSQPQPSSSRQDLWSSHEPHSTATPHGTHSFPLRLIPPPQAHMSSSSQRPISILGPPTPRVLSPPPSLQTDMRARSNPLSSSPLQYPAESQVRPATESLWPRHHEPSSPPLTTTPSSPPSLSEMSDLM